MESSCDISNELVPERPHIAVYILLALSLIALVSNAWIPAAAPVCAGLILAIIAYAFARRLRIKK